MILPYNMIADWKYLTFSYEQIYLVHRTTVENMCNAVVKVASVFSTEVRKLENSAGAISMFRYLNITSFKIPKK